MGVSIRAGEARDVHRILALIDGMGGHQAEIERSDARLTLLAALGRSEVRILVAESEGEVVGYAELHERLSIMRAGREAWLAGFAIDQHRRRSGVGRALLAAVDAEAALLGCRRIALESSVWRDGAHAFYRSQGFSQQSDAARFVREIHGADQRGGGIEATFLVAAARAAGAAQVSVAALAEDHRFLEVALGADGAPTSAADRTAESAIVDELGSLGVPIISEESGLIGTRVPGPGEPWIAVDPLDGSRNHRNGYPPYATAIALVRDGRATAGLVADLTSARRWWAIAGQGAWSDGRRCGTRASELAVVTSPTPESGAIEVPGGYSRVRMAGSTTLELCAVAEGSAGAWIDATRGVTRPHDLAAPSVIVEEAGGAVLDLDEGGRPEISPDPSRSYRLVAAYDQAEACRLRHGLTGVGT